MDRFRATEICAGASRLIVIESIETEVFRSGDRTIVYGAIEPFAVVTCCRDSTRAIDMQANPISLTELTRAVPELREMIGGSADGSTDLFAEG